VYLFHVGFIAFGMFSGGANISHQPAVLFSQNEPAPASSTLLSEQTSTSQPNRLKIGGWLSSSPKSIFTLSSLHYFLHHFPHCSYLSPLILMVYLGSWGGGALEPHYWACSPFKIIESG
jgi:hypothetical protein